MLAQVIVARQEVFAYIKRSSVDSLKKHKGAVFNMNPLLSQVFIESLIRGVKTASEKKLFESPFTTEGKPTEISKISKILNILPEKCESWGLYPHLSASVFYNLAIADAASIRMISSRSLIDIKGTTGKFLRSCYGYTDAVDLISFKLYMDRKLGFLGGFAGLQKIAKDKANGVYTISMEDAYVNQAYYKDAFKAKKEFNRLFESYLSVARQFRVNFEDAYESATYQTGPSVPVPFPEEIQVMLGKLRHERFKKAKKYMDEKNKEDAKKNKNK